MWRGEGGVRGTCLPACLPACMDSWMAACSLGPYRMASALTASPAAVCRVGNVKVPLPPDWMLNGAHGRPPLHM